MHKHIHYFTVYRKVDVYIYNFIHLIDIIHSFFVRLVWGFLCSFLLFIYAVKGKSEQLASKAVFCESVCMFLCEAQVK